MTMPPDNSAPRRGPQVFSADDPELVLAQEPTEHAAASVQPDAAPESSARVTTSQWIERGFRWGLLLVSAAAGAVALSLGLWFTRIVSVGLERDDWLGWIVRALVIVAAISALALLIKELAGWRRLGRLGRLRKQVESAIAAKDVRAEGKLAQRIQSLYTNRSDLKWALERVKAHHADVLDPAQLLTLLERDLVSVLDTEARRQITSCAKRVATVTAMSPLHSIAFGYVVFENLRMLRRLATIYGGRPGFTGAMRLGRTVLGNLIAAGGLALTDDLFGQFIGQDLVRRLSARLGEGAFNGALTARIGVAAISEVRPLPFLEASAPRARDILAETLRPSAALHNK